ncbi:hypothetical protein QN277_012582 [Acacia crassicarpa]|uniref:Secreted protein n=1 Tax=Acacia crassicarpa TaxID=499986 RepID=A0AAE1TD62_9FABA|nr:hypothetical protein QN277_012582 [Acacia crassicarpa]
MRMTTLNLLSRSLIFPLIEAVMARDSLLSTKPSLALFVSISLSPLRCSDNAIDSCKTNPGLEGMQELGSCTIPGNSKISKIWAF